MTAPSCRVGCSRIDITPDWPVPLAGFASRRGRSQGIAGPLYLRAAIIETRTPAASTRAVIVAADIIWWPPEQTADFRAEIARRFALPAAHVLLSATHTHSGPQTSARFAPALGTRDDRFVATLEDALYRAIAEAAATLAPVEIQVAQCEHDLAVNRRARTNRKTILAANPPGAIDPQLTVVSFSSGGVEPRCLLVHYACHPVISSANVISGDYPGAAMNALEGKTGAVALFLQGCCGDINPGEHSGARFLAGGEREIQAAGLALANSAMMALADVGDPVPATPIAGIESTLHLPFARKTEAGELLLGRGRDAEEGEWARVLLPDPTGPIDQAPLGMQRLDIGAGLSLIAINAEVVVDYGLYAKRHQGNIVLPMGYSNGMIGYLPTAAQLREGGYEPIDSVPYFLLPSPFSADVEAIVREGINDLLGEGRVSRSY